MGLAVKGKWLLLYIAHKRRYIKPMAKLWSTPLVGELELSTIGSRQIKSDVAGADIHHENTHVFEGGQNFLHHRPIALKKFLLLTFPIFPCFARKLRWEFQVRGGKIEDERGIDDAHLQNQQARISPEELGHRKAQDFGNSQILKVFVDRAFAVKRFGVTVSLDCRKAHSALVDCEVYITMVPESQRFNDVEVSAFGVSAGVAD